MRVLVLTILMMCSCDPVDEIGAGNAPVEEASYTEKNKGIFTPKTFEFVTTPKPREITEIKSTVSNAEIRDFQERAKAIERFGQKFILELSENPHRYFSEDYVKIIVDGKTKLKMLIDGSEPLNFTKKQKPSLKVTIDPNDTVSTKQIETFEKEGLDILD